MGPCTLARYYSVLEGDATAKYLECKEELVCADMRSPTADLWRIHDEALGSGYADGTAALLDLKVELARRLQSECAVCERRCGARRFEGTPGHCGVLEARVTSEFLHMGEEPDLVPSYTIFFAGCTFDCVFCQNHDISTRPSSGSAISPHEVARMIESRTIGAPMSARARNVNWVGGDPSPNLHFILQTLSHCRANIPQIWNSNMYLTEESMSLLEGVVDVYLTDFKYGNDECALRLSNAPDYMRVVTRNHTLARRNSEMIVRHLVLPGHVECCTRPALTWVSSHLKDVKVNVMSQFRPEHRAREFPELARGLRAAEYQEAIGIADQLGLDLID